MTVASFLAQCPPSPASFRANSPTTLLASPKSMKVLSTEQGSLSMPAKPKGSLSSS
jgi:hypothetical protein